MSVRRIVHTICVVVLIAGLASSATGTTLHGRRTTHFTFDHTVELPGAALPPGSYVFEVADLYGDSNIVRITSGDRTRTLLRVTRSVQRPVTGNLKATITLGETPANGPQPITAWYPQGETFGRQFIY